MPERPRPPHRVARPRLASGARPRPVVAAAGVAVVTLVSGAAQGAGGIAKGPYLTGLSDSRVDVRFELAEPGPAVVEVVREGQPASSARVSDDHKTDAFHVVSLGGLEAATRYSYTVRAGSALLGAGRFATAPKADSGAPLKFLVYGDDRTDVSAHQAVVRALQAVPSDLLINTGDLVADGASGDDWRSFFDTEAPLLRDRALFVAIGNHELYDDSAGTTFARYFGPSRETENPPPYGSARLAGVRFFFLNGMHDWTSGEERQWLEHELASADGERGVLWRIAVVHHSPWSAGPHGGNAKLLDAHVPELLSAHQVDLVLSGHDHIYERGDAGLLKYIISGGGGAPLYRVIEPTPTTRKAEATYHFVEITADAEALRVVAHRLDGSTLEKCDLLRHRPPRDGAADVWGCDPSPWVPAALRVHASGGAGAPPAQAVQAVQVTQGPAETIRPAASSRCGCEVPGARDDSRRPRPLHPLVLALAALALSWGRRLRRS